MVGVKGGAKVSTKNGPEIIMVSFSELSLFCKKEKTNLLIGISTLRSLLIRRFQFLFYTPKNDSKYLLIPKLGRYLGKGNSRRPMKSWR